MAGHGHDRQRHPRGYPEGPAGAPIPVLHASRAARMAGQARTVDRTTVAPAGARPAPPTGGARGGSARHPGAPAANASVSTVRLRTLDASGTGASDVTADLAAGRRTDRRRRNGHRAGVGWWQTPPQQTRRARRAAAPAPRTSPESAAPTHPAGPVGLLRRVLGSGTTRRRRRIRLALLVGTAAVVLLPVLLFAVGYLLFSIPTPDQAVDNQVALISYADGSQLTRLVPEAGNRTKVSLDEIPVPVRNAVLAAEDRSFYTNPGFDVTGILRAAWNQLRGGVGGGSTITQQYVKITLVGDDVSMWRKYREMIVSFKLSQERTKDEILNDYLNTIYFGRGAYGIQSASQAYFGKDVGRLTPSEGALLAGVIQSPSRWDPAIDPAKAVQRWTFVMDGMVAQGWLSPAERAAATFPQTQQRRTSSGGTFADSRGHIVNAVRAELDSLGITDQELAQGGLRIDTTIDPAEQEDAVRAARASLAGQPDNLRSAIVAVDPGTGAVRAYYGGENGVGLDYARVRKQAGSTFKPFVVLAALLRDPPIGLGEMFDGSEQVGLRNADGADCPRCDVKQAMTVSNNVVFTKLARMVGPENVAAAARAAGIHSPLDNPDERIALGNKEVTPLELASAYATIASGGVWHEPHFVSRIVTSDGRVLYEAPDSGGERRFSKQVARNVTEAMLDVAPHDGVSVGRPVAAKTGTVQSRLEGENNDAWFSGFTPSLATTVWIGTDMNSPIRTSSGTPISGRTLPSQVWEKFMTGAVADEPAGEDFGAYKPIGTPPSNREPGAAPSSSVMPTPSASDLPPSEPPPSTPPAPPAEVAPVTPTATARATSPEQSPLLRQAPTTPPRTTATPAPDCSVDPCG